MSHSFNLSNNILSTEQAETLSNQVSDKFGAVLSDAISKKVASTFGSINDDESINFSIISSSKNIAKMNVFLSSNMLKLKGSKTYLHLNIDGSKYDIVSVKTPKSDTLILWLKRPLADMSLSIDSSEESDLSFE
jgi:hypothetical protein